MRLKQYIPNAITFLRLISIPPLAYFILRSEYVSAFALFALICLTDKLDGAAARAFKACSRFGACFDVFADLAYLLTALIALNIRALVPVWFTIVTAMKFIEFAITSSIWKTEHTRQGIWLFDGLGRCYAVLAILTPGVACLAALLPGSIEFVRYGFLVPIAVLAVVSSFARIWRCVVSAKPNRGNPKEKIDSNRFRSVLE